MSGKNLTPRAIRGNKCLRIERRYTTRRIIHFVVDKVPLIAFRPCALLNANTVYHFRTFITYSFRASSIKQSTRNARAFLTIINVETDLQLSVENQHGRELMNRARIHFRINRKMSRILITRIPRAQSGTTDPAVPGEGRPV